ncbi:hypothetical protein QFZ79_002608 [Arthrobacter sp. V4I6]|nr:hypothetical protein [Arthrobacter sp. V1I7]MDQ0854497.1 hypothetical protein [Arthrobacter sp. V4I6]
MRGGNGGLGIPDAGRAIAAFAGAGRLRPFFVQNLENSPSRPLT